MKSLRKGVKNGTANRLDLLKAEDKHKEYLRDEQGAMDAIEAAANKIGLTTHAARVAALY